MKKQEEPTYLSEETCPIFEKAINEANDVYSK